MMKTIKRVSLIETHGNELNSIEYERTKTAFEVFNQKSKLKAEKHNINKNLHKIYRILFDKIPKA